MKPDNILTLKSISKSYISPEGVRTDVLKGIDMQVAQGETIAITGPSGSGKSTLLNIIGTLDSPSEGDVILNGHNISKMNNIELSRVRNSEIGFVFQLHHLLPQCTVLENILIPGLVCKKDNEERARVLLDRVGLSNRADSRPGQLSGGECQRAAVVRALINSPSIILADEPTGSLDAKNADNLARLLIELNKEENVTLIVVTHSLGLAAQMDRKLVLADGRISESR